MGIQHAPPKHPHPCCTPPPPTPAANPPAARVCLKYDEHSRNTWTPVRVVNLPAVNTVWCMTTSLQFLSNNTLFCHYHIPHRFPRTKPGPTFRPTNMPLQPAIPCMHPSTSCKYLVNTPLTKHTTHPGFTLTSTTKRCLPQTATTNTTTTTAATWYVCNTLHLVSQQHITVDISSPPSEPTNRGPRARHERSRAATHGIPLSPLHQASLGLFRTHP